MTRLRTFLSRLWALGRFRQMDHDIDQEIASHLAEATDEYIQQGLSPEDARFAAQRSFGGVSQTKEVYRQVRSFMWLESLARDVRHALHTLRATPIVTCVAVSSLALGIGANTAIFSLIDSLTLRTVPGVEEPAQLVTMYSGGPDPANPRWSYQFWKEIENRSHAFGGALAWSARRFELSVVGDVQPVDGAFASGSFFETLGVSAIAGRTFTAADDVPGGTGDGPVAVISYNLWQRSFGGSPQVVGTSVTLNRVPFTIIGVTPAGFFGTEVGRSLDVAIPLTTEALINGRQSNLQPPFDKFNSWLLLALRLKPGQSLESATSILRGMQPAIRESAKPQLAEVREFEFIKEPLTLLPISTGISPLRRSYQQPLVAILFVVALVLLIACANIANLQMARATTRRHELSIRRALGAAPWQLTRQLLIESLLLAGLGAAVGLVIASWGSRVLVTQISTPASPITLHMPLDWRVLGFTMTMTVATALLFGMAPALQAARVVPLEAINAQGRGLIGEHRTRFAGTLVVLQVGLSLVLVVFAGLFVSSFQRLTSRPLGFDRERMLLMRVDLAQASVKPEDRGSFYHRLVDRIAGVPGVEHVAASDKTPFDRMDFFAFARVTGAPRETATERIGAKISYITRGWFASYHIPLRAGRDFDAHDRSGGMPVLIVNETFVRKFLAGKSALGSTVEPTIGAREEYSLGGRTVVGVVGDTIYSSLREAPQAIMYLPLAQYDLPVPMNAFINISVRSAAGSPASLTSSVNAALAAIDKNLTARSSTFDVVVNDSVRQERLLATLTGSFATLALLLAGLGLYGVTAYTVARRRTEIGIRMALGAVQTNVIRLVVSRAARLVGIGVLVGTVASLWLSRFVASLLYGLEAGDRMNLLGAAAVLAAVGITAALLPAVSASRTDPAAVLRES